ncbi:MAG: transcription termination factor NusA, partial [Planctomycetota bacterium]|nr:transcription termination factor NusA [Planctomycetota bacterium]
MKSEEILRLVDTIHRSKEIEKEVVFQGIEAALLSAVRRKHGESEEDNVIIDRETGVTTVIQDGQEIDPEELGRLAAMSGKQVMFQKIREAERDRIFEEYEDKIGQLVSGVVQRYEGPNLIVSLGRVEGFLPRSEQAPGERFRVGERIKSLVKDLQKSANRVKITLSRTDRELVKALFALEIPEVQDNVIEIKEIAREAGYRTKIAVTTYDTNVDCVGACVGVRGSRIKNIVDELFGEKIDIVRWNESDEVLIIQALKPAEISTMELDDDTRKATIYVKPDQQSLAIGKRGQNVRLASKLTGWELEIEPITDEELEQMRKGGAGEVEVDIEAEEAPEDTGEEAELTEETLLAQEADEETVEDSPEADGEGSEADEETEEAEAETEAPVEEAEEAEAETEAPAEEAEEAEAETEAPAEEAEEAEAETEAPAEEAEEAEAETEAPAEEAEEAEAETE